MLQTYKLNSLLLQRKTVSNSKQIIEIKFIHKTNFQYIIICLSALLTCKRINLQFANSLLLLYKLILIKCKMVFQITYFTLVSLQSITRGLCMSRSITNSSYPPHHITCSIQLSMVIKTLRLVFVPVHSSPSLSCRQQLLQLII